MLIAFICMYLAICVTCCRHIITCGSDGDVHIYKGFGDNDPVSYRFGDAVYCVRFKVCRILQINYSLHLHVEHFCLLWTQS